MTFEHERETQIIIECASLDNSSIVMKNYLATKIDFLALNSTGINKSYYLKNSGQEHVAQISMIKSLEVCCICLLGRQEVWIDTQIFF